MQSIISIGIMAHNEERVIAATLEDLLGQDIFSGQDQQVEILVLVNGSTDRTANIARQVLAEKAGPGCGAARVLEIARAGKANAWNEFVHGHSFADADTLICMDADIRLPQADTLTRLVSALEEHPESLAAVDEPVKSIAQNQRQRHDLRRQLSLAAAQAARAGPPKLCGQLYAARADALRRIVLPEPMLVEDGFIKAMLATDGFSRPERDDALVRAPGAFHLFEAETRLAGIFRHEKRIVMGTVCNIILFAHLRRCVAQGRDAAAVIREGMAADANWFRRLIAENMRTPQRRADLLNMVLLPLRQWQGLGPGRSATGLAAALVRTVLTVPVAWAARRDLRRNVLHW